MAEAHDAIGRTKPATPTTIHLVTADRGLSAAPLLRGSCDIYLGVAGWCVSADIVRLRVGPRRQGANLMWMDWKTPSSIRKPRFTVGHFRSEGHTSPIGTPRPAGAACYRQRSRAATATSHRVPADAAIGVPTTSLDDPTQSASPRRALPPNPC